LNNITLLVLAETNLLSENGLPVVLGRARNRPNRAKRLTIIDKLSGGQNQLPFARRWRFSSYP
jgi:hypothetical protein